MKRSADPARAALVWVGALLLAAWPPPAPSGARCPSPHGAVPETGWTRLVRCRGEASPLRGPPRLLFGLGIDPNRADAATLEVLPGIGPERARALLRARRARAFCRPEDLERAMGIGPRTRLRIAPWLALEPCPAPASRPENP